MIKYFCDACGKEELKTLNRFSYLCHIDAVLDHSINVYVDNDRNVVSGRSVSCDLCNECYNKVVVVAVKKIRELKSKNPDSVNDN
jgi:hypothetical protein